MLRSMLLTDFILKLEVEVLTCESVLADPNNSLFVRENVRNSGNEYVRAQELLLDCLLLLFC